MSEWAIPGYTELNSLGEGGFGTVMLARHDATGTPVAVKYLRPDHLGDPYYTEMFRAEAITLGSLDDPYVTRLYEYLESPAGAAIVMELVDGVTLREILSRFGKTSPEAALVVLYGSLLGLAAAHARGVVHRDYKPTNVLVNGYGASKLTDFGIAVLAGTDIPTGATAAYAPPEQWDAAPASPASDVYAATVTFYECLTGQRPFTAESDYTLAEEHRRKAVPMGPVPEPLRPIVARGMAKDPRYRPADAAALATELRAVAADAYGQDWESRGRSQLGQAALLLAALWPTAGVPALQGSTIEQIQLHQAAQNPPASARSPGSHAVPRRPESAGPHSHQVSRAELHRWHLWHVLHLDHLAHLRHLREQDNNRASGPGKTSQVGRALRTSAVVVTGAAVVAAAATVAATSGSHPSGGSGASGTAAHPAVVTYPVSVASTGSSAAVPTSAAPPAASTGASSAPGSCDKIEWEEGNQGGTAALPVTDASVASSYRSVIAACTGESVPVVCSLIGVIGPPIDDYSCSTPAGMEVSLGVDTTNQLAVNLSNGAWKFNPNAA